MKFAVTFGQKYHREEHPCGGHPDGWFEIEADDEMQAREKVFSAMGEKWAFIYPADHMDIKLFPRGKIGEL